ncbi:MAG: hypothetical protein QXU20_01000 [Candidatus Woesearchaeota archaeon]
MKLFEESKIKFYASEDNLNTGKGFVFYNPLMRINRDFSVLLLKAINEFYDKELNVLELMAASGIRALRFALQTRIKSLEVNDISKECYETIIKNFEMNSIPKEKMDKIRFHNLEANSLLLKSSSFDYIQIDPFDNLYKFIDLSLRRIKRGGILGLTTTDTATLSGTYKETCIRRYCSKPLVEDFKHEFGLRIIIKDLQTIASKKDIFLKPILCYYYKHHYGLFFSVEKSKKKSNSVFEKHNYLLYCKKCSNRKITDYVFSDNVLFNTNVCDFCSSKLDFYGSFYSGFLCDQELLSKINIVSEKMKEEIIDKETKKILALLIEENRINVPFTFNTHLLAKKHKLNLIPLEKIIRNLKENGFEASRTHFEGNSLRTNAELKDVLKAMNKN